MAQLQDLLHNIEEGDSLAALEELGNLDAVNILLKYQLIYIEEDHVYLTRKGKSMKEHGPVRHSEDSILSPTGTTPKMLLSTEENPLRAGFFLLVLGIISLLMMTVLGGGF